jgi:hypothetical protein
MQRPVTRAVLALVAAGGLLFGLLRLGQYARDRLDQQDHYAVTFAALRCETPPGLTPGDFRAEVQYLSGLPDRLNLLEPGLAARLVGAFALHPWVERVEGVALRGPDGPVVRLRLRTPALVAAGRVVDGNGVLLPATAPADGLPTLRGTVPPPAGPAGAPWGDAGVEGAARTAAWVRPFPVAEVEVTAAGLVLHGAGGERVVWGRPVGADPQGEPPAEAKRERLRARGAAPGAVDLRTDS